MNNIFVFTAGNAAAQEHWETTIANPIDPVTIYNYADQSLANRLQKIDSPEGFYAWGAVPGDRNIPTWKDIQPGDLILGYYGSAYRSAATIQIKFQNRPLAEKLWGTDPSGRTWEYMYLMSRPVLVNVGLDKISELNKAYRGFVKIGEQKTKQILTNYGSFDKFVTQQFIDNEQEEGANFAPKSRRGIPNGITRDHLIQAIMTIDNGAEHRFSESTKFDVLYQGARYWPKAVVGIAAQYIIGHQLLPSDFSGGKDSDSFSLLLSNGFDIVTKGGEAPFPEEIDPDDLDKESHTEGAVKQVTVNKYERDGKARKKCIEAYGPICKVCGLNFLKRYGVIGEGFIHVHHIKQLSEIGEEYVVDPLTDLVPVCPNCHAMLHKKKPPYSIKELKKLIN